MNIAIRALDHDDLTETCRLVREVFDQFVAPHWSKEGVDTFHRTSPAEWQNRLAANDFINLGAELEGELVGVLMMSIRGHLNGLFVSGTVQRAGIGRQLLSRGVRRLLEVNPSIDRITLNAAPNSIDAHKVFGFETTGPEMEKSGLRFTPMQAAVEALLSCA